MDLWLWRSQRSRVVAWEQGIYARCLYWDWHDPLLSATYTYLSWDQCLILACVAQSTLWDTAYSTSIRNFHLHASTHTLGRPYDLMHKIMTSSKLLNHRFHQIISIVLENLWLMIFFISVAILFDGDMQTKGCVLKHCKKKSKKVWTKRIACHQLHHKCENDNILETQGLPMYKQWSQLITLLRK